MQNKKLIVLIVLGMVAVFSLFYGIFTPSKGRQKDLGIQKKEAVTDEKGVLPLTRRARRSIYSSWARNPFSPAAAPIKAFGGLTLSGILGDKENPLAIINKEIVKIGDRVAGNIVVDIKQDRVILSDGEKELELRLGR